MPYPSAERLLRLYPRAWRERFGEEFIETAGPGALAFQQVVDIVSGAIDAWLSADVRRASRHRLAPNGGGSMTLKSMAMCGRRNAPYTKRDALIGAGVMLGSTLLLTTAGMFAHRNGWRETGQVLMSLSFTVSLTISMPFWLMKGQPWRAQVAIVGGTLAILLAIGCGATLI